MDMTALGKFGRRAFVSAILLAAPHQLHAAGYITDLQLSKGGLSSIDASEELPSLSGSFLAAQVAAANNDDAAAVENYRRAIALDSDNTNLKLSLFMALTANGDIGEALALLQEVPAESQTQNVNYVVIAAEAMRQKSWSRAITNIDKVRGSDLDMLLARIIGAWAHLGERKPDAAMERLGEASGPDWAKMIKEYHGGLILAAAGRDAEAIKAFEIALSYKSVAGALTDTYMRAFDALARAYMRSDEPEKAKRVVEEGLTLIPSHVPLEALLARIEAGETVPPLITTAQEGAGEIFFNVGSAISRQGNLPFAQSHLQLARFLSPKSGAALFSLAKVYENQDRFERANAYYEEIPESSPYYRRARLEAALNLDRLDQFEAAEARIKELIEADPDDLITVLSLGGIYARHEKYAEAAAVYEPAIARLEDTERHHWSLFYRRGIAYERTDRWDEAEKDFKKALELSPEQPDVLNYLGYSWVDMGIKLDEGLEMIRKAVELRPNSGFIIDSLGWAYYRLGRYEDAVEQLERALKLMPSDPVVNDHLGDAYWKTGRKLEATFQWKHALANDPETDDKFKITAKLRNGLIN